MCVFLKLHLLLFKGYLFQIEIDGMIFFTSLLNALQELQSVLICYICFTGLPNLCKIVSSFEVCDKDSFEGRNVPHTFITTEKLLKNYTASNRIHENTSGLEIFSDNLFGSYLSERNHIFRGERYILQILILHLELAYLPIGAKESSSEHES